MSGRRTNSTRPAARVGAGLAAAALVSLALPVTTGTAAPATPSAASAATGSLVRAADPEFAGYAATTSATPVRIEIYEPTIPIPASPQAELNLGYSVVKADSSTSRGRASFFWPGDAVGEGFKTIVENLGLPPELAGPIAEQGYPVQVNSNHPAGPASESSEDLPGSIQRTSASAEKTMALAGYSTDCRLGQPDAAPAEEGEGGEGGEDEGPIPGLPGLPDLPFPGIPGLGEALSSTVDQTVTTLTGGALSTTGQKGQKGGAKAAEEEVECPIPAQLAAVIDLGGVGASSTVTRSTDDDGIERVKAVSRSVVGEVSLLGGIITLDGLELRDPELYETTADGRLAVTGPLTGGAQIAGLVELGPTEIQVPSSGIGALVVTSGVEGDLALIPMLRGGGQERGRRAGTENLPGIAGFGAAAEAAADAALDVVVCAMVRARLRQLFEQPGLTEALERAEAELPADQGLARQRTQVQAQVVAVLAEYYVDDPETVARDVLALAEGMAHAALRAGEAAFEPLAQRVERAVTGYLAGVVPEA